MRIEINSGGVGAVAVSEMQSALSTYIGNAANVIDCFKTVKGSTSGLNGGVGNLESALSYVDSRVQSEETKLQEAKNIQNRVDYFIDLAMRVDNSVSEKVNKNKNELYRINPWLKPITSVEEEIPWYEQAWNWLCDTGETVVEGAKQAWNCVSDTAKKAWNGIVEFYQEHKKIIDTALIVVSAIAAIVAVVASGGWALVPLLIDVAAVFGITASTSASIAIAISTGVAVATVVTTVVSSTINIIDIWTEIDNPVFNAYQKVLNISSTLLNITYSIGTIYNMFEGYRITKFGDVKVIQNDNAFDPMKVDQMGRTNIERMARKPSLAPIGKDGKSMELHHLLQTTDGGLVELTQTAHRGKDAFSFWHITDGTFKSVVDHGKEWRTFAKSYWNWRGSNNFLLYDKIIKDSTLVQDLYSVEKFLSELFSD